MNSSIHVLFRLHLNENYVIMQKRYEDLKSIIVYELSLANYCFYI